MGTTKNGDIMRKFEWLLAMCCLASVSLTSQTPPDLKSTCSIGVVNINACITDSRQGLDSRQALELINQKAADSLQDIDKQIQDIDAKLSDEHYRDSLTPQAVEQMRQNHEKLLQEREIRSNDFRQQMSQMHFSLLQELMTQVSVASETVAKKKGLSIALSGEGVTYFDPSLDITGDVVEELNKTAEQAAAKAKIEKETAGASKDSSQQKAET